MSADTWDCRYHRRGDDGKGNRGARCDYCDRPRAQAERKSPPAAARVRPSHEAIAEALSRAGGDTAVLPLRTAIAAVRNAFRTTLPVAAGWLRETYLDSDEVWAATVSDSGHLSGLVVRNLGRWPNLKSDLVGSAIGEKGVTDHLFTDPAWLWLRVDEHGHFTRDIDKGWKTDGGLSVIVLRSTLDDLLRQAEEARQAAAIGYAVDDMTQEAAFARLHPEAVGTLRGLLEAAGGHAERAITTSVHDHGTHGARLPQTTVRIEVRNVDIDLLVTLLQRLGVKPVSE